MVWLLGALNHRFWSPRMDRCARWMGRIAPPTCIAWPICIIWRPSTHLVESCTTVMVGGVVILFFLYSPFWLHILILTNFLVLGLGAFLEISTIFSVIIHALFFVGRWELMSRVFFFLNYSGHYASILLHFYNFCFYVQRGFLEYLGVIRLKSFFSF